LIVTGETLGALTMIAPVPDAEPDVSVKLTAPPTDEADCGLPGVTVTGAAELGSTVTVNGPAEPGSLTVSVAVCVAAVKPDAPAVCQVILAWSGVAAPDGADEAVTTGDPVLVVPPPPPQPARARENRSATHPARARIL
jgi:hypothetical protein